MLDLVRTGVFFVGFTRNQDVAPKGGSPFDPSQMSSTLLHRIQYVCTSRRW